MPDITKCNPADCPLKLSCYRFTAPAEQWQYYFIPEIVDGKCDMYWEVKDVKE